MKQNTLITLAFACILTGCYSGQTKSTVEDIDNTWRIITIDSCEYIENKWRNEAPLIHKANCKNPAHKL